MLLRRGGNGEQGPENGEQLLMWQPREYNGGRNKDEDDSRWLGMAKKQSNVGEDMLSMNGKREKTGEDV